MNGAPGIFTSGMENKDLAGKKPAKSFYVPYKKKQLLVK